MHLVGAATLGNSSPDGSSRVLCKQQLCCLQDPRSSPWSCTCSCPSSRERERERSWHKGFKAKPRLHTGFPKLEYMWYLVEFYIIWFPKFTLPEYHPTFQYHVPCTKGQIPRRSEPKFVRRGVSIPPHVFGKATKCPPDLSRVLLCYWVTLWDQRQQKFYNETNIY